MKWGFDMKDIDPKVRPQDDFFHYASGTWLKRNPIPKNEARWGTFTMLRVLTEKQLQKLVQKVIAVRKAKPGSPEQLVRDFVRSGMNLELRRSQGIMPIQPLLNRIERMKTPEDVVHMIAALEKIGSGGIWSLGIDQDMKNSERYIVYLGQGGLGLPDRDYYLNPDKESKRVRNAYEAHLIKLLRLAGRGNRATQDAAVVLEIETSLAKASMKKEDVRDVDKTYHKKSLAQLGALAPNVDWRRYFKLLDIAPKDMVVMQPNFLIAANKLLTTYPIESWKTYLRTHVINDYSSYLTPELERQSFAFYGTVLTGTKQMKPLWRRILRVVNGSLGEILGALYVKNYFPPEAKQKVVAIVDDLFTAYEARINSLDWMTSGTKRKAIAKLRMMNKKLGYPDKWKSYAGLKVLPNDYAGNVMRAAAYEHRRYAKRLPKPVDRKEWFMMPQTVNAYCGFLMNDIVFPAAILQHPFFNVLNDDAVNYAAIGSVIGHEITHGFDDQGSKFDGKGNRRTWWTATDRSRYKKKSKLLVKQFNAYEVEPGVHVNGEFTLGENIADLGGLSIAFDAYKLQLARTGRTTIDGFTPEQRFFLGYAGTERERERPEYRKMMIMSDPHPPSVTRVNGPVSNLPEFYEAFNVKPGDKLYRAPKDRAKIW
jgi:putative endopeptidase